VPTLCSNVENWLDSIFQPDYTCFGCASLFNRSPNWNLFHLIFCSILHSCTIRVMWSSIAIHQNWSTC
jgi:hypothetical protein